MTLSLPPLGGIIAWIFVVLLTRPVIGETGAMVLGSIAFILVVLAWFASPLPNTNRPPRSTQE